MKQHGDLALHVLLSKDQAVFREVVVPVVKRYTTIVHPQQQQQPQAQRTVARVRLPSSSSTTEIRIELSLGTVTTEQMLGLMQSILKERPNSGVARRGTHGDLPIHTICRRQGAIPPALLRFLIQQDPHCLSQAKTLKGWLPLHVACSNRVLIDTLQFLLQHHPQAIQNPLPVAIGPCTLPAATAPVWKWCSAWCAPIGRLARRFAMRAVHWLCTLPVTAVPPSESLNIWPRQARRRADKPTARGRCPSTWPAARAFPCGTWCAYSCRNCATTPTAACWPSGTGPQGSQVAWLFRTVNETCTTSLMLRNTRTVRSPIGNIYNCFCCDSCSSSSSKRWAKECGRRTSSLLKKSSRTSVSRPWRSRRVDYSQGQRKLASV